MSILWHTLYTKQGPELGPVGARSMLDGKAAAGHGCVTLSSNMREAERSQVQGPLGYAVRPCPKGEEGAQQN